MPWPGCRWFEMPQFANRQPVQQAKLGIRHLPIGFHRSGRPASGARWRCRAKDRYQREAGCPRSPRLKRSSLRIRLTIAADPNSSGPWWRRVPQGMTDRPLCGLDG